MIKRRMRCHLVLFPEMRLLKKLNLFKCPLCESQMAGNDENGLDFMLFKWNLWNERMNDYLWYNVDIFLESLIGFLFCLWWPGQTTKHKTNERKSGRWSVSSLVWKANPDDSIFISFAAFSRAFVLDGEMKLNSRLCVRYEFESWGKMKKRECPFFRHWMKDIYLARKRKRLSLNTDCVVCRRKGVLLFCFQLAKFDFFPFKDLSGCCLY